MLSSSRSLPGHPSGRPWVLDDFDYDLPAHLIAQEPLADRAASRLLVVKLGTGVVGHSTVRELGCWLRRGDLLVANNSRVIPARVRAKRAGSGGRAELLLLHDLGDGRWRALARPSRRLRPGSVLVVAPRDDAGAPPLRVSVEEVDAGGQVTVRFPGAPPVNLDAYGETPLPPYIGTALADPGRYQTVYADRPGSAAAPTAGLHFTPELIDALRSAGVGWAEVTLHVGLDTFRPVTVQRVEDHPIHREWCSVPDRTALAIAQTKQTGGRVIAVGTTSARTLEFLGRTWDPNRPQGTTGMADLFIVPGYRWALVDGLLTNFHLPRTTLLMMVGALAGVETIRAAYAEAIDKGYRFYSFGDAMLILPMED
jgi:S-adenosylmethionine:tRNA ribosyltransferase-isomerase